MTHYPTPRRLTRGGAALAQARTLASALTWALTSALTSALTLTLPSALMLTPTSSVGAPPAPAPAAAPVGAAFTLLHSLTLPVQEVSGIKMQELSGLAWDADEKLLYAVSDRGSVFHFELTLGATRIERLVPVHAARLHDPRAAGRKFNAEGLAVVNADNGIQGDTQLVIALEDGPTVGRFTPRGEALADVALPPLLTDAKRYRGKNKRLESVTAHPVHGFVMAPEAPLKGEPALRHRLYATDSGSWSFAALQAGSDIKAIEALADGTLLVLERVDAGATRQAALRRIDPARCGADRNCPTGDAPDGQARRVDGNFEGMARLRGPLILLVSDGGIERQGAARFALIELSE